MQQCAGKEGHRPHHSVTTDDEPAGGISFHQRGLVRRTYFPEGSGRQVVGYVPSLQPTKHQAAESIIHCKASSDKRVLGYLRVFEEVRTRWKHLSIFTYVKELGPFPFQRCRATRTCGRWCTWQQGLWPPSTACPMRFQLSYERGKA